eukprot:s1058_g7.t1
MSISVDVHLLSGKRASTQVEADASVASLKHRAQTALASRGRPVNSSGEVLDGSQTVTEAKLMSRAAVALRLPRSWVMDLWSPGVVSTMVGTAVRYSISCDMCSRSKLLSSHVLQSWLMVMWSPGVTTNLVATAVWYRISCEMCSGSRLLIDWALAAILGHGSVVTWGHAKKCGDSSAVQEQLKTVQQIQASAGKFAAFLGDGSVVTRSHANCGGDSSAVQDQLRYATGQHVNEIRRGSGTLKHDRAVQIIALPAVFGCTAMNALTKVFQGSAGFDMEDHLASSSLLQLASVHPSGNTTAVDASQFYTAQVETCYQVGDLYEAWALYQFCKMTLEILKSSLEHIAKDRHKTDERRVVASGLLVAHKSLADIAYTGVIMFLVVCCAQAGWSLYLLTFTNPEENWADYNSQMGYPA